MISESQMIIHEKDQELVHLLKSMVRSSKQSKWWIAGGTALNWYQGKPCNSDVDIFFRSESGMQRMFDKLSEQNQHQNIWENFSPTGYSIQNTMCTENAVTFKIECSQRSWDVQLVKREYFETAEAVIDDFDITVCQIATDGNDTAVGEWFARDVRNKRLRFHKIGKGSAKRLVKYWCYGYEPTDEEIKKITSDPKLIWQAGDDDYA
jgi:hypothetical protein